MSRRSVAISSTSYHNAMKRTHQNDTTAGAGQRCAQIGRIRPARRRVANREHAPRSRSEPAAAEPAAWCHDHMCARDVPPRTPCTLACRSASAASAASAAAAAAASAASAASPSRRARRPASTASCVAAVPATPCENDENVGEGTFGGNHPVNLYGCSLN